jgi:pectinesterase
MDITGRPIDMLKRRRIVKHLSMPQDAQTIASYSDPSFVLGGWKPVVE